MSVLITFNAKTGLWETKVSYYGHTVTGTSMSLEAAYSFSQREMSYLSETYPKK
jgi:hypothetical protein